MARSTIAIVVIFLLAAGGAWALNLTNPPPATDQVYVLDTKEADVQRLDVTTSAGSTAFERAEPFGWKFADSGNQADLSRVSSVVNRMAKLRSSAKVADSASDLAPYGLAPPAITVTLTMKDGMVQRVLIGNKTVNDAAYYAMVPSQGQLHTINTLVVGDTEKLVTEPPVPTPTPDPLRSPTPTIEGIRTLAPVGTLTPEVADTPVATTPTIGLPGPSVGE
jgi:hypothetical protein